MDDKRNIILAVALTALILFGWPYVAEQFFPTPQPTQAPVSQNAPSSSSGTGPITETVKTIRPLHQAISEAPRIPIETPKLTGSINLKGARIDDIVLPTYNQTIKKDSPPVRLFSPSGTKDSYFGGFGWTGDGLKAPDANTVWAARGDKLTPSTPVTLRWNNGQGQIFEIKLAIDQDYMFTVTQKVTNTGKGAAAVRPYGYISHKGVSADPSSWTIHTGPIGVFDGKANYDVDFTDLDEDGDVAFTSNGGWIGFTDKYWLSALIPDQKAPVSAKFRKGADDLYQADFSLEPALLAPGKTVSQTSRLFVGAKETKLLERYQDEGVTLFDRAIDWGWFYWFEKPIFFVLHWLFENIGNFGVAIIILTFIVRLLMFPIAQKQFASMAAMRAVQPKMKALQEKFKDDKPRLQQEMMELYRKEKVNPLAGCLPMFLQIPIFFALYKVLMLTIEMRHQPFVLWIKDLSAPDPLHILNLFGLLDFNPPAFLGIGVLALLLGLTMFLQFRLNPAQMDPTQQQIFAIMPWMMMFIMAPFAAGLLVYWITSNILTIAQQKWLYSRHPALREPAKAD
ncbi:MAG TPA: membrane protein insertase YidC [Rhizorhapis sp.]